MNKLIDRVTNLLSIKSIVTLALTVVFCLLASKGSVPQEIMVTYSTIIGFYFGTQAKKD